ncbi:MAG TPA: SOS response-associated peptidase [Streptosporangiaceae bacterium]
MCGRYASARKREELLAEFRIERDRVSESLEPDYNVAPTKPVYAVMTRGSRGHDGSPPLDVARELRVVRWGLVPSWAKEASIGSRLINARAETVDSKPAFRQAFTRRRCLLPADGFYEWQQIREDGRVRKQPYYIHPADGGVLAFAGLYEIWRDKEYPEDHPAAWLWTSTIITTRAEDTVGQIHDRMPMVIEPARWADWLDPGNSDRADLMALLAPAMSGRLTSDPVSTAVNAVRNNGPTLIEPLATEPGAQVTGGQAHARSGTGPPPAGPAGPGAAASSRHGAAGPPAGRAVAGRHPRDGDQHPHPASAPLTLF